MPVAVLTVAAAAVMVTAAYLHLYLFAVTLVLGQAVLAAGWFGLVRAPGAPQGIRIALMAALLADLTVLRQQADASLEPLAGVLGLVALAVLFQQVVRSGGRYRVVASMAATASAGTVVTAPVAYLATWSIRDAAAFPAGPAPAVVACVLAGAAVAAVASMLPKPEAEVPVALLGATVLGAVLGQVSAVDGTGRGACLALAGGGLAVVGRKVTEYGDPSARASRSVAVLLPLALGGPAAYLLGHFLMG